MGFETTFANDKALLLSDSDQIVFGTCMLGEDYGEVKSASVKRTSDKRDIESCVGGLRGVLLTKLRFELQMEARFDADVDAPGEMDMIVFPLAGVTGRIMDPEVKWESGGERMLSFTATYWDEIAEAHLYSYDGTDLTEIDMGPDGL